MEQDLSPFKDRLFLSFLLLLVWLPLPLGSNRIFAWSLMEVAVFIICTIWLWQHRQGKREIPAAFNKAWPALIILGLWLLFLGFQILPMPYQWVASISPQSAVMHALVEEANAELITRWVTIAVSPDVTLQALIKSTSYVLFFVLTLLLVKSRAELEWLCLALVTSGLIQALYGIFMVISGLEYGFFMEKSGFKDVVTGTFINRNSFANYVTLCMAVGIGLLLAQLNGEGSKSWRAVLRKTLDWLLSGKMRLRFMLIIMAVALVMTHSRMGNAAFFLSLLIAGIISIILSKHASRSAIVLLSSLVILDLLVIGSMVGMDRVVERIEHTSAESVNRDEVALDMLNYWDDYQASGSGLGSYYTTYPGYRSAVVTDSFYNHAHNDYLEMLSEVGVAGVLILGLFILATLWVVISVLLKRYDPWCRGIAFSALMSICAILIHATVDFNLQIPANTATFIVIIAMGWLAFGLPSTKNIYLTNDQPKAEHRVIQKNVFSFVMLLILFILLVKTAMTMSADLLTSGSNFHMEKWQKNGTVETLAWQKQFEKQEAAIMLSAKSFYAYYTKGRLAFWQPELNTYGSNSSGYKQMHQAFKLATESAPVNPMGWLLRAVSLYYLQDFGKEFQYSLHNASETGRWNSTVQSGIIALGQYNWDKLSPKNQQMVLNTLEDQAHKNKGYKNHSAITALDIDNIMTEATRPIVKGYCGNNERTCGAQN